MIESKRELIVSQQHNKQVKFKIARNSQLGLFRTLTKHDPTKTAQKEKKRKETQVHYLRRTQRKHNTSELKKQRRDKNLRNGTELSRKQQRTFDSERWEQDGDPNKQKRGDQRVLFSELRFEPSVNRFFFFFFLLFLDVERDCES